MTTPATSLSRTADAGDQPLYLRRGSEVSFAVWHPAAGGGSVGVVLCPPFGWEEVSSYRPRRAWAQALAGAGYGTLRLTLPSTGDSAGEVHDPHRVDAWTSAVATAAEWLRTDAGARRVVAIGMGLGGLLAYRCAALGGAVDDLVLWGVAHRGRAFVRQLKALARMEGERFFERLPPPPPDPDGELAAGGFVLSAETVRDLERLDLTDLTLPDAHERRVLVIGRDGPADAALVDHLETMGALVSTADAAGYEDMTSHPQYAEAAPQVLRAVQAWLAEAPEAVGAGAPTPAGSPADPQPRPVVQPRLDPPGGAGWVEWPVAIPSAVGTLPGIVAAPAPPAVSDLCAVLLNPGSVRRTGPNRMWVEVARRWSARGVPCLRVDFPGIGDAEGAVVAYPDDALYHRDELLDAVGAVLDFLQEQRLGDRFLLVGLCSGAFWAFRGALDDPRVTAVVPVNQRIVAWDVDLAPARYVRVLLTERPSLARIRRVVTLPLLLDVLRWLFAAPARAPRRTRTRTRTRRRAEVAPAAIAGEDLLERLRSSGPRVTWLFAHREPLHDELARAGWIARLEQTGRVRFERVAVADHTLRPPSAQREVHAALDRVLERELATTGPDDLAAPASRVEGRRRA